MSNYDGRATMAEDTAPEMNTGGGLMFKVAGTAVVLAILIILVVHPDFVNTVFGWIGRVVIVLRGVRWLVRADTRVKAFVDLVQQLPTLQ